MTQQQAIKAVEEIIKAGWTFEVHSYQPTRGWWRLKNSNDPVKAMRRGDPKGFHAGAVAVKRLYLLK